MKDYYKVLGVKETASEEEIRERWVGLTKRHHPDRRKAIASDEKIREINEAYQVLKHSSTRVEYDLKRTYGYEKREEKRRSHSRMVGIFASVLIIFITLGVIYLKNYENHSPELTVSKQINSKHPTNQKNLSLLLRSESLQDEIKPAPWDEKKYSIRDPSHRDSTKSNNPINPNNTMTPTTPTNPFTPIAQAVEIQRPLPPVTIATASQTVELTPQPWNLPGTPEPKDPPIEESINPVNPTNPIEPVTELVQTKLPSLLTTEDEVRKFFDSYIERYNRMDIEGFLSLFSLKAIQNQKEELESIRKIYTNFFNQGKELKYRMQEMRIEIYQNAVEVRAHYEIEQILKTGGERKFWKGQVRWILGKENGSLKIISLNYQRQ
jgi:curved DNA-binding protein CbpA